MLSKVKSVIILVLSVMLAFETGMWVLFVGVMRGLQDETEKPRRRRYGRVSYQYKGES